MSAILSSASCRTVGMLRHASVQQSSLMSMSTAAADALVFKTITFVEKNAVVTLTLNRPERSNAMNRAMWAELRDAFKAISASSSARAVVVVGAGRNFTSGRDLMDHQEMLAPGGQRDVARTAWKLQRAIADYQASLSAIAECPKPVITSIHGHCIGGGVDLVCAADIRIASTDAIFCVKETEIGMAADVGTLQRLPRLVGSDSLARELCFSSRRWPAEEALKAGFLSSVHADAKDAHAASFALAQRIASFSPVAVQGTKLNLNYARDHSTADALAFQAVFNSAMLQGCDIPLAVGGGKDGVPVFPDL